MASAHIHPSARPVEDQESRRLAATLARQAHSGAGATEIADAVVAAWRRVDNALRPIVGQRGVASLYKRSLHLANAAYPWLGAPADGVPAEMDLEALRSKLAEQDSAMAAAAGGDLFQMFHELLIILVGPSLTERLLRPVWADSPSGPPAQDTSP